MLLRAVELHNFRGYRNFKLKFAPLTSLLGEGEVGKKTILRALDIFFNGPLAKRPLKLQDLNEKALKAGDWQIAITCYFDDFAIKKSFANCKNKLNTYHNIWQILTIYAGKCGQVRCQS
ncbi:ATP-binding protein, partial [Lactobacillus delbrueckii]